MNFGGISTGSIATAVWALATRVLTSLAANYADASSINVSVTNGTTLDLRPAAGKMRHIAIFAPVAATGNWTMGTYDGTTFRGGPASGAGTAAQIAAVPSTHTFGAAVNNSGTGANPIDACGFDIS